MTVQFIGKLISKNNYERLCKENVGICMSCGSVTYDSKLEYDSSEREHCDACEAQGVISIQRAVNLGMYKVIHD